MSNLLECEKCGKCFQYKSDYYKHFMMQSNCGRDDKDKFNTKIHKCDICGKEFSFQSNLVRHKKENCKKVPTNLDKNGVIQTVGNNENIKQVNYIKNNIQSITNNINNVQPNIQFVRHGKETIDHITKEVLLKLLNQPSFTWLCTEFMRVLYFNVQVPQNNNWCIAYPKNEEAAVTFNYEDGEFERKSTIQIIDDKFSNMMDLLYPILSEIHDEDEKLNNLNVYQKKNIKKYFGLYGVTEISTESTEIYKSVHKLAFKEKAIPMASWRKQGFKGNHLSLKF